MSRTTSCLRRLQTAHATPLIVRTSTGPCGVWVLVDGPAVFICRTVARMALLP